MNRTDVVGNRQQKRKNGEVQDCWLPDKAMAWRKPFPAIKQKSIPSLALAMSSVSSKKITKSWRNMASWMLMKGYTGLQSKTWSAVVLEEGFTKMKACDERWRMVKSENSSSCAEDEQVSMSSFVSCKSTGRSWRIAKSQRAVKDCKESTQRKGVPAEELQSDTGPMAFFS